LHWVGTHGRNLVHFKSLLLYKVAPNCIIVLIGKPQISFFVKFHPQTMDPNSLRVFQFGIWMKSSKLSEGGSKSSMCPVHVAAIHTLSWLSIAIPIGRIQIKGIKYSWMNSVFIAKSEEPHRYLLFASDTCFSAGLTSTAPVERSHLLFVDPCYSHFCR
jgi:hypothetical protein